MEDQVLTVEQMMRIMILGIDTSLASMCWVDVEDGDSYLINKSNVESEIVNDNVIVYARYTPTFTYDDILKILPKFLNINDETFFLTLMYDASNGVVMSYCTEHIEKILHSTGSSKPVNAAFDMLLWVNEKKYI